MIVCFVIGKFSIQLWYIFVDIGQIFSVVNGQILKTYFRHVVTLATLFAFRKGVAIRSKQNVPKELV